MKASAFAYARATSVANALDLLKKSSINWTYFSPAAFFVPGERTGKFRLGQDQLIANEQHDSRISLEDYAIALADELESPTPPTTGVKKGPFLV